MFKRAIASSDADIDAPAQRSVKRGETSSSDDIAPRG
jgi:hypothetical protein